MRGEDKMDPWPRLCPGPTVGLAAPGPGIIFRLSSLCNFHPCNIEN